MMFLPLRRILAVAALSLGLAACRSAPMHFYTLQASLPVSHGSQASAAPFAFELLPVSIPSEDDLPQLVVRSSGAQAQILDNERWIGPLADQVRGALSANLSRDLASRDVSGLAQDGQKVVRIKVALRRIESSYGGYALIDAAWSVRPLWQSATALTCANQLRVPVQSGYDALVLGQQHLLQVLSARIASAIRQLASSGSAACPVN